MSPGPLWFLACALGLAVGATLHVLSVRHSDLGRRFGPDRGNRMARGFAMASSMMESVFLAGLWLAPQPRFWAPLGMDLAIGPLAVRIGIPGLLVASPLLAAGAWLGIQGVRAVGLESADTHEPPPRLQTGGVYAIVRHPQYLGWALAHVGASVLLSATWAILFTPGVVVVILVISKAEEADLVRAFGDLYLDYMDRVPMLLPRP